MKTNQIMHVSFLHGTLEISHLDRMGDLNSIFAMGNKYRALEDLPIKSMQDWLKLHSTKEFLAAVEKEIKRSAVIASKGSKGKTKAHLLVLIDAAAYLAPALKIEIYLNFIEGKLLEFRDESGEYFKDLNVVVAEKAIEVLGKPSHKGHYITLANIVKERFLGKDHAGWNYATPEQLTKRARLNDFVVRSLEMGRVKDWEDLKKLVQEA